MSFVQLLSLALSFDVLVLSLKRRTRSAWSNALNNCICIDTSINKITILWARHGHIVYGQSTPGRSTQSIASRHDSELAFAGRWKSLKLMRLPLPRRLSLSIILHSYIRESSSNRSASNSRRSSLTLLVAIASINGAGGIIITNHILDISLCGHCLSRAPKSKQRWKYTSIDYVLHNIRSYLTRYLSCFAFPIEYCSPKLHPVAWLSYHKFI